MRPRKAWLIFLALPLAGCPFGEEEGSPGGPSACFQPSTSLLTGSEGSALVFDPDPAASAGIPTLSPTSLVLDQYREAVQLQNLDGRGVLSGTYANVRNGLSCAESYGVYSETNQFEYSHAESGFAEAMAYHHSDLYRSALNSVGYLMPAGSFKVVAHCMRANNAYYSRGFDSNGKLIEKVCMGDSVTTPGASYADDAQVMIHELQHSTTTHAYSIRQGLNQYWFDEAGALNESFSDMLALIHTYTGVPANLDAKVFSRWALGRYSSFDGSRSAHRCPQYDSDYPECKNYGGFSADNNTLSLQYPDGAGWPYAKNIIGGAGHLREIFQNYTAVETIHNAGMLVTGAMWDVFEAVLENHNHDYLTARDLMTKVIIEAIRNLPKPTAAATSPVTFVKYAAQVVAAAPIVGFTAADQSDLDQILNERGLHRAPQLGSGWATVGPGRGPNVGLRVDDNPNRLRGWLYSMGCFPGAGCDPSVVTQGVRTGLNQRLDPGEVVALWFDVRNLDALTAGGLELTVTSSNSKVTFLGAEYNSGFIDSSKAQIRYLKVNGSNIVNALNSSSTTYHVPMSASYFGTNPFFDERWYTALWVKIDASAQSSETVNFSVSVEVENGPTEVVNFGATIQ